MAENTPPNNPLATTPMLRIPDLVERLGVTPGRLHRLIEDRHLASVRIDGIVQVPAEFLQGDEPLPPLRGTLLVLQDAGFSQEEAVIWLLSENEELGERPIDSLQAGRKSAVRRATQALAF
ncbi:Rv2175c family DNA-binding protein [Leucobacter sp. USHLN153]|uniref:Rv2175c family DNA-binding protein n=1 Tax=Leucobacter sp. USHLN153 TaxID=3081268 RepID=UPI003FA5BEFC